MALAASTLARSVGVRSEMPIGLASVRNGRGAFGLGISRAREHVPHGGAA